VTIFAQNKFGALLLDPQENRITAHMSSHCKADHAVTISFPNACYPLLIYLLDGGNVTKDVHLTSGSEEGIQALSYMAA
jgi:hypothetical protein